MAFVYRDPGPQDENHNVGLMSTKLQERGGLLKRKGDTVKGSLSFSQHGKPGFKRNILGDMTNVVSQPQERHAKAPLSEGTCRDINEMDRVRDESRRRESEDEAPSWLDERDRDILRLLEDPIPTKEEEEEDFVQEEESSPFEAVDAMLISPVPLWEEEERESEHRRERHIQRDVMYDDPLMAPEYIDDIDANYRELETREPLSSAYMDLQPEITPRKRLILVDWLIDVHSKFKMEDETLFLTVNLIDRFLARVEVPQEQLQLVGVTALLVASKYEEIYPPELSDLVYITDKAYSAQNILDMEEEILKNLNFKVTVASPLYFLNRFLRAVALSENRGVDGMREEKVRALAHYLCEMTLIESHMMDYLPSALAASSAYLARKLLGESEPWDAALAECSRYQLKDLDNCIADLQELVLPSNSRPASMHKKQDSVQRKYSAVKYQQVALLDFHCH